MLELCAGRHHRSLRRYSVHLVCLGYVCRDLRCVGLFKLRRGHLLKCGCVELRGLYRGHLRSGDVVYLHHVCGGYFVCCKRFRLLELRRRKIFKWPGGMCKLRRRLHLRRRRHQLQRLRRGFLCSNARGDGLLGVPRRDLLGRHGTQRLHFVRGGHLGDNDGTDGLHFVLRRHGIGHHGRFDVGRLCRMHGG